MKPNLDYGSYVVDVVVAMKDIEVGIDVVVVVRIGDGGALLLYYYPLLLLLLLLWKFLSFGWCCYGILDVNKKRRERNKGIN